MRRSSQSFRLRTLPSRNPNESCRRTCCPAAVNINCLMWRRSTSAEGALSPGMVTGVSAHNTHSCWYWCDVQTFRLTAGNEWRHEKYNDGLLEIWRPGKVWGLITVSVIWDYIQQQSGNHRLPLVHRSQAHKPGPPDDRGVWDDDSATWRLLDGLVQVTTLRKWTNISDAACVIFCANTSVFNNVCIIESVTVK